MEDLGYPLNVVELIGNIYTNSTTSFHGNHFGTTLPIQINRSTIQGDTISPYLFIIFLDPLLIWLEKDNIGYHLKTSTTTCNTLTYADDLAILTDNIAHIQAQICKLQKFYQLHCIAKTTLPTFELHSFLLSFKNSSSFTVFDANGSGFFQVVDEYFDV